jgi:hypothetical protein
MACSRSSVNVNRTRANVAGIIIAAPTARNPRAPINTPAEGEKAAISEHSPNTLKPPINSRLCPRRSPSVPMPSNSPAAISA